MKAMQKVKLALTVGSVVSFIGCTPLREGIQRGGRRGRTAQQAEILKRTDAFSKKFYATYPHLKKHKALLKVKFIPDRELRALLKGSRPGLILKGDNACITAEKEKNLGYLLVLPKSGNVSEYEIATLIAKFAFQHAPKK